jgi:hypothetical protein
MSCSQWEDKVALYTGGDLEAAEAAEISGHLAACPDCRSLSEALRQDREEMEALTRASEPSAADLAGVRLRVFERIERRRRAWRGLVWALAPALAGLVVFALVAPLGKKTVQPPTPVPPVRVALGPQAAPARVPEPARAPLTEVRRRTPRPTPARVAEGKPLVAKSVAGDTRPATPARMAEDRPLAVKFFTDDPNVVIVWLFDKQGD